MSPRQIPHDDVEYRHCPPLPHPQPDSIQSGDSTEKFSPWTPGRVPVENGTGIVFHAGWIHRTGRFGLRKFRQTKTFDPEIPPYALHHIPTGFSFRLYPSPEVADYMANWLFGLDEINRDDPLPLTDVNRLIGDALIVKFSLYWHEAPFGVWSKGLRPTEQEEKPDTRDANSRTNANRGGQSAIPGKESLMDEAFFKRFPNLKPIQSDSLLLREGVRIGGVLSSPFSSRKQETGSSSESEGPNDADKTKFLFWSEIESIHPGDSQGATAVCDASWSWSPAHERVVQYFIDESPDEEYWVLWEHRWGEDDADDEATCAVKRNQYKSETEAALALLAAVWEQEKERLEFPHEIIGDGILYEEQIVEIANRVWPE